jgi:Protein of unknown function (DUF3147)
LLEQIVSRFLIGGLTVSIFSLIGDILKPKSFAGLFGAAPSVALATQASRLPRKESDTRQLKRVR